MGKARDLADGTLSTLDVTGAATLDSLTLTTDLAVADGGTGAGDASGARTALGLVIGTDVQAYIAPGTSGNVLTSNGTTWTSAAAAAFDSGTVMMFGQTSAPTGWTKDTTNYNNSSLRVVTGAASTGGSVDFTTAFTSQIPTGSVSITSVTGSAGATTLSTPQIPSHRHISTGSTSAPPYEYPGANGSQTGARYGGYEGGGGSHNHPFSFSSGSGTFNGNAINLAVKYVDVIRASKD